MKPALAQGRMIVVAPYVNTAIAFGRAAGLGAKSLREIFAFAPRPDESRVIELAESRSLSDRTGFAEFACDQLLGAKSKAVRRKLIKRAARTLKNADAGPPTPERPAANIDVRPHRSGEPSGSLQSVADLQPRSCRCYSTNWTLNTVLQKLVPPSTSGDRSGSCSSSWIPFSCSLTQRFTYQFTPASGPCRHSAGSLRPASWRSGSPVSLLSNHRRSYRAATVRRRRRRP